MAFDAGSEDACRRVGGASPDATGVDDADRGAARGELIRYGAAHDAGADDRDRHSESVLPLWMGLGGRQPGFMPERGYLGDLIRLLRTLTRIVLSRGSRRVTGGSGDRGPQIAEIAEEQSLAEGARVAAGRRPADMDRKESGSQASMQEIIRTLVIRIPLDPCARSAGHPFMFRGRRYPPCVRRRLRDLCVEYSALSAPSAGRADFRRHVLCAPHPRYSASAVAAK